MIIHMNGRRAKAKGRTSVQAIVNHEGTTVYGSNKRHTAASAAIRTTVPGCNRGCEQPACNLAAIRPISAQVQRRRHQTGRGVGRDAIGFNDYG